MSVQLWEAPTQNATQTTLDGSLSKSSTTITLASTTGLVAPGVVVIDRTDGTNDTPTKREYVTFTGISGSDLTGCSRGVAGSSAQAHGSGAKVETTITVTHWNDLVDFLEVEHDASGQHVIGTATVNYTETYNLAVTSLASVPVLDIGTRINASGASITGFGIGFTGVFSFIGSLSGPTTSPQTPLVMPEAGTLKWINIITRTVASTATAIIDMNLDGTSIFDATARPVLVPGATFVSTASINTTSFTAGQTFDWDFDTPASADMHITDINIIFRSE